LGQCGGNGGGNFLEKIRKNGGMMLYYCASSEKKESRAQFAKVQYPFKDTYLRFLALLSKTLFLNRGVNHRR
jgi:hypothetical protein